MTTDLRIHDLRTLFLYLSNATMCIPYEYKKRVFMDMAFKLHEWADVPNTELRTALEEFGYEYYPPCEQCNEETEGEDFLCNECLKR
jgi:hypothetical protein